MATPGDQFSQGFDMGLSRRFRLGFDDLAELRESVGIDRIGLGEFAQATSEVPHLSRIGHHDIIAGMEEFDDKWFFVPTGRFEDDLGDTECLQTPEKLSIALGDVEIAALEVDRLRGDLERFFGNVDPDVKGCGHGVLPFLPMRAWRRRRPLAQAAVRVHS